MQINRGKQHMGKTRDLFKKAGDIKGTCHAKMGMITYKNSKDLIKAEKFKKRWQEYTEELHTKDLHDPDNHNGVITHQRARLPRMRSQVGLGKHHYKQS